MAILLIFFTSFIWAVLITFIYKSKLNKYIKILLILICLCFIFIYIQYSIIFIVFLPITAKYLSYSKSKTIFTISLLIILHIDTINFDIKKKYYCDYKKEYEIKIVDNNYTMSDLSRLGFKNKENPKKLVHFSHFYDITINVDDKSKKVAEFYGTFIPYPFVFREINLVSKDYEYFGHICGYENLNEFALQNLKNNHLKNLKGDRK